MIVNVNGTVDDAKAAVLLHGVEAGCDPMFLQHRTCGWCRGLVVVTCGWCGHWTVVVTFPLAASGCTHPDGRSGR